MKIALLAAAILLSATQSMAFGWTTKKYVCQNPGNQKLTIEESASKVTRGPLFADKVEASLSLDAVVEQFDGDIEGSSYVMEPAADGKEVQLQVVAKKAFAFACGRCPGGESPIPVKPTYFAKLTVGNQIYNFTCDAKNVSATDFE